jgi:prepilin-type N-terminal cleavage/methylation domain-containing protein
MIVLEKRRGFTIVELLVVIVVIAILAAITVIAYNGIQNRAKNTRTMNAVVAYTKAIKLYIVDNGTYPVATSCLGTGYTGGWCRSGSGYVENGNNFNTMLAPYLGSNLPTPSLDQLAYSGTITVAGAFYIANDSQYDAAGGGIGFAVYGGGSCPSMGGLTAVSSNVMTSGDRWCRYALG